MTTMHQPPTFHGYRPLSQDDVDAINDVKEDEANVANLVASMATNPDYDQRCVALAKTNLQQGFMWLARAIAKPTGWEG